MDLVKFVEYLISSIGPFGVFWASVLEEIIVIIPSSVIQLGAGFFILGSDPLNLNSILKLITNIAIPAGLGVSIGSLPVYFITYYLGERGIKRFGKWFFIKWEDVDSFSKKLHQKKYTGWFFIFLRFLPIVPNVLVTAFCGLIRMSFKRFIILTFFGIFVRTTIMASIGWTVGDLYYRIASKFDTIEKFVVLVFLGAVLLAILWAYWKMKNRRSL